MNTVASLEAEQLGAERSYSMIPRVRRDLLAAAVRWLPLGALAVAAVVSLATGFAIAPSVSAIADLSYRDDGLATPKHRRWRRPSSRAECPTTRFQCRGCRCCRRRGDRWGLQLGGGGECR